MSFKNKIALVTGGSEGLGFAIAKELADQGATVIITGRRRQQLDDAAQRLGANVSAIQADAANLVELDTLYQSIQARHGRLDVLVANAGVGDFQPLGSITEEHFDRIFNVNVKGVTFTVQKALPLMAQGGSIVLVGSTASMDPGPGLSVYGASKAALRNLARSWIQDIKGSGIRINVLSPGPVMTEGLRRFMGDNEAGFAAVRERSFVGRIGEPDDIGRAVAFLASDASGYINGVELFADGGASQI
jgi:NAD(P)-dependent dehydrogenase (short-subunit alcohol dehydrogenase family)